MFWFSYEGPLLPSLSPYNTGRQVPPKLDKWPQPAQQAYDSPGHSHWFRMGTWPKPGQCGSILGLSLELVGKRCLFTDDAKMTARSQRWPSCPSWRRCWTRSAERNQSWGGRWAARYICQHIPFSLSLLKSASTGVYIHILFAISEPRSMSEFTHSVVPL